MCEKFDGICESWLPILRVQDVRDSWKSHTHCASNSSSFAKIKRFHELCMGELMGRAFRVSQPRNDVGSSGDFGIHAAHECRINLY